MASRSIIQIHPVGPTEEEKGFAVVSESFASHDDAPEGAIVDCSFPAGADAPHPGDRLYEILSAVGAIKSELDFTPGDGQPPVPVYLDDRSPVAQTLPWEALRRAGRDFLALDERRPVGRIAGTTSNPGRAFEPIYDPPLRVLAVISAAGIDGVSEWRQLYRGLKRGEADTPFRLHTVVAESSVADAIDQENDPALSKNWLHSEDPQVSRYDTMLLDEIRKKQPNILHFFCHGMPGSRPMLELSTRREKITGAARGSVLLDEGFFRELAKLQPNIWLVLLNCCHGATREESCSLARRIVELGFPAAIGMREAIETHDADVFCGELYRTVGALLRERFGDGNNEGTIDWVASLTAPRNRLCVERVQTIHRAEDFMAWTYPVIYVDAEPFLLRRSKADLGDDQIRELLEELHTLRESRDNLARAGVPPAVLEQIDQRVSDVLAALTAGANGDP